MTELVERYVHQVGQYLSKKDRADIEQELRSLIQDQLDDRYPETPTQAEVAAVLTGLGSPRRMAASYYRGQYLIGPELYPPLMSALRYVWMIVPTVVIFLNIFGALASLQRGQGEERVWFGVLVETLVVTLQATLIFSAVVILIFALIERIEVHEKAFVFDPLRLPKVDDPRMVDRFEVTFGIAFGSLFVLIFLYFLQVGGLTMRFNPSDPGEVIPVPASWMIVLIVVAIAQLLLHLRLLRRNRWSSALWMTQTVLEVAGMICLYFVVYRPLLEQVMATNPSLFGSPVESIPEIIVIFTAMLALVSRGSKLVQFWNYPDGLVPTLAARPDG